MTYLVLKQMYWEVDVMNKIENEIVIMWLDIGTGRQGVQI